MGKKRGLVGIWEVKYMFQSGLLIFMIIGSLATIAFYVNVNPQDMNIPYVNVSPQDMNIPTTILVNHEQAVRKEYNTSIYDAHVNPQDMNIPSPTTILVNQVRKEYNTSIYDALEGCNLFKGKWVFDNKYSYPLYKEFECPYIYGDFACGQHGRKDSKYQQWRWQPHGCHLPRFDAREVLERLRGKRVIFVGDSVNRNQWVSMLCMLQSVIPLSQKKLEKVPKISLLSFKAFEYDVSIDFYWAPLLVESNGDHPSKHRTKDRIVRMQSIEKHAKNWLNADVLVFNSYLWWRMPTVKILNGSFEDPTQNYNIVNNRRGYRMALKIWSKWLHAHINHTTTQIYFMSMTATHHRAVEWGKRGDQSCFNEIEPITKEGFWESGSDLKMLRILESSLDKLKTKGVNVQMINITQLTQYRKDAHPSIHRLHYSPLTKKQRSNPSSYADCTHWCLPGTPDVWNELLLAYILRGHK